MWDWVFPPLCASCAAPLLPQEKEVCLRCLLRLPQTLFWRNPTQNEAYYRLAPHAPALSGAISGFWYVEGSPLRAWVQLAKYHNQPQALYGAAYFLGTLIRQEGLVPFSAWKALLPVPISGARLRKRGYNQAEWAARGLAQALGVPLLTDRWRRLGATASQVAKGRIHRWTSLEGEFACVGPIPSVVAVVDDVLTTGATLSSALRSLPPETQVWVVTVGITQRRS